MPEPSTKQIARAVEQELGVRRGCVLSPTRGRPEHAWARALAMWIYHSTNLCTDPRPFAEVGRAFDRDRTTARHAIRRVEERIRSSQTLDVTVSRILEKL